MQIASTIGAALHKTWAILSLTLLPVSHFLERQLHLFLAATAQGTLAPRIAVTFESLSVWTTRRMLRFL